MSFSSFFSNNLSGFSKLFHCGGSRKQQTLSAKQSENADAPPIFSLFSKESICQSTKTTINPQKKLPSVRSKVLLQEKSCFDKFSQIDSNTIEKNKKEVELNEDKEETVIQNILDCISDIEKDPKFNGQLSFEKEFNIVKSFSLLKLKVANLKESLLKSSFNHSENLQIIFDRYIKFNNSIWNLNSHLSRNLKSLCLQFITPILNEICPLLQKSDFAIEFCCHYTKNIRFLCANKIIQDSHFQKISKNINHIINELLKYEKDNTENDIHFIFSRILEIDEYFHSKGSYSINTFLMLKPENKKKFKAENITIDIYKNLKEKVNQIFNNIIIKNNISIKKYSYFAEILSEIIAIFSEIKNEIIEESYRECIYKIIKLNTKFLEQGYYFNHTNEIVKTVNLTPLLKPSTLIMFEIKDKIPEIIQGSIYYFYFDFKSENHKNLIEQEQIEHSFSSKKEKIEFFKINAYEYIKKIKELFQNKIEYKDKIIELNYNLIAIYIKSLLIRFANFNDIENLSSEIFGNHPFLIPSKGYRVNGINYNEILIDREYLIILIELFFEIFFKNISKKTPNKLLEYNPLKFLTESQLFSLKKFYTEKEIQENCNLKGILNSLISDMEYKIIFNKNNSDIKKNYLYFINSANIINEEIENIKNKDKKNINIIIEKLEKKLKKFESNYSKIKQPINPLYQGFYIEIMHIFFTLKNKLITKDKILFKILEFIDKNNFNLITTKKNIINLHYKYLDLKYKNLINNKRNDAIINSDIIDIKKEITEILNSLPQENINEIYGVLKYINLIKSTFPEELQTIHLPNNLIQKINFILQEKLDLSENKIAQSDRHTVLKIIKLNDVLLDYNESIDLTPILKNEVIEKYSLKSELSQIILGDIYYYCLKLSNGLKETGDGLFDIGNNYTERLTSILQRQIKHTDFIEEVCKCIAIFATHAYLHVTFNNIKGNKEIKKIFGISKYLIPTVIHKSGDMQFTGLKISSTLILTISMELDNFISKNGLEINPFEILTNDQFYELISVMKIEEWPNNIQEWIRKRAKFSQPLMHVDLKADE